MLRPEAAPPLCGLYVITDARLGGGHLAMARAALAGGTKILQLRDKTATREIVAIAHEMRELTRQNDALFIINDDLDLALECEADGVHLGDDDTALAHARRILGRQKIIGISASTPELAREAQAGGASYLGVGAVFGTATKLDAGAAIGLEGLRAVVDATTLPVAAIGGVNAGNLASVLEAGAAMACVISALWSRGNQENLMTEVARDLAARCEAELRR